MATGLLRSVCYWDRTAGWNMLTTGSGTYRHMSREVLGGRWNGWEALPIFILIYQLVETFDFTFRHLFPDTRMTSPNACFRQETSPKNFEYLVFIVKVKLWWTSMQVGCETTQ